jgi:MFS family permease
MSTVAGGHAGYGEDAGAGAGGSLWNRQLARYPDTARRTTYLAITVLATVVLYYELYVQGAVATKIISDFGFSFGQFVGVLVVGNLVGAFASLGAGLADRWGRANLVVGGLLLTGLLTCFALPNASSKGMYTVFFALVSIVEGMALVATPALIRDFSPQIGRASAMAFWTMGPVLGSPATRWRATRTGSSSSTSRARSAWWSSRSPRSACASCRRGCATS